MQLMNMIVRNGPARGRGRGGPFPFPRGRGGRGFPPRGGPPYGQNSDRATPRDNTSTSGAAGEGSKPAGDEGAAK